MIDVHADGFKRASVAVILKVCVLAPAPAHAWLAPHGSDDATPSIGAFTITGAPITPVDTPGVELVLLGDPPSEVSIQQVVDAMGRAGDAWTQVPCSYIEITVGGVGQAAGLTDGQIPVVFLDPTDAPTCFPVGVERLAAAPCPIGDRFGVALNARDYTWSPEPDQNSLVFGDETFYAIDAVLTHELGHVLGLGHSADDPLSTMVANYLIDGGQLTLSADDRRGVCALYPTEPAAECASDAECVTRLDDPGATCDASASPRVCEQERGDIGDTCSSALQICPGTCLETSGARTGYCTVECDEADTSSCPTGFICDARDFTDGTRRGLCVYSVTPSEASSCATSSSRRPVTAWWVLGLLVWAHRTRRRSRRARS